MGKQSVWKSYDQKELKEVNAVCERYKTCLDAGKTERECVALAVEMAKEAGYKDLNAYIAEDKQVIKCMRSGCIRWSHYFKSGKSRFPME